MKFENLIVLLLSSVLVSTHSLFVDVGVVVGCNRGGGGSTLCCNDTFPTNIPDGVTEVIIVDYTGTQISFDMFRGKRWKEVEVFSLTTIERTLIMPRAFTKMDNLKRLGLHGQKLFIRNDSFEGISVLDSLNLHGCFRMTMMDVLGALNGSRRIRRISELNIAQLSVFKDSIKLSSMFSNVLGPKQLTMLNISYTTISEINLTALTNRLCNNLSYVIMTGCNIAVSEPFTGICPSLKKIDMDKSVVAQVIPGYFPPNIFYRFDLAKANTFNFFVNIENVNIDRMFRNGLPPLRNLTIASLTNVTVRIKKFILSNNGLRCLDLKLINVTNCIEFLDMSSNGLSYLQPTFLSESGIQTLDLSHNSFNEMAKNNVTEFRILFMYITFLQNINMSANKLAALPSSMFRYNKFLKSFDLSNNYFSQIDPWFDGNPFLVLVNLTENEISLLTSSSMTVFDNQVTVQKMFQVDLRKNKLLCNRCESKNFISWLIENDKIAVTDNKCLGETGSRDTIDESTVKNIEDLCKRTLRIALITTASIVSFVTLTSTVYGIRSYRKGKNKEAKLNIILDQFREGRHKFKYLTFVAFSGEDEDFVEDFVMEPLRENISTMTGTERELICTGDRNFKPGFSIAEQMEECCRQSGVVVLVISKSFCASIHCGYETRIAFTMQKPIILLFKEHVPESDMTPLLRIIFRQFARVHFRRDGRMFRMSTTWQNVCEAILELIVDPPNANRRDQTERELETD